MSSALAGANTTVMLVAAPQAIVSATSRISSLGIVASYARQSASSAATLPCSSNHTLSNKPLGQGNSFAALGLQASEEMQIFAKRDAGSGNSHCAVAAA